MIASANKIGIWRRCQKKYFYCYVLDIERIVQSIAPSKGSIVHACLEAHYKSKDWTQPINDLQVDLDNVFEEEAADWLNLPAELYKIVRGYLAVHSREDKNLETLGTEIYFKIPIGAHEYEGYIDKVEQIKGQPIIQVVDYKTAKEIPDVTQLYMDVPTAMYAKAVSMGAVPIPVTKGSKVVVVFDHIRTKPPRTPDILKNGTISRAACDTDVTTYMETVKANGLNVADYQDMIPKLEKKMFYRRAAIPLRKSTVEMMVDEIIFTLDDMQFRVEGIDLSDPWRYTDCFPRTYMRDRCPWDCQYHRLCTTGLCGGNQQELIDLEYQKRKGRPANGIEEE